MFSDIFEDIFQPMFSDMFGLSKICQAIRFNGANNYGQLATRAIDPDGDVDIEFFSPENTIAVRSIVTQLINASNPEFDLLFNSAGQIRFRLGKSDFVTLAEPNQWLPSQRYRVTLIGTSLTLYDSLENVITSQVYVRGNAREPTAVTLIGSRAGTGFFFQGIIPYIRINNQYWAMDAVGQAIQPSLPAGNNMTLFNTVPEQWETISCGLRPQV